MNAKWLLIVIAALLICVAIVAYSEQKEVAEQVSIQKADMEVIGSYKLGAFLSVWKIHDNKDNVTCWIHGEKGGISCIPDHMLSP